MSEVKKEKSNRQVSLPRTSTNIPLSWCKQTFKTQNLIWEAAAKAAKSESSWIWLFLNSLISDWDYFDTTMEYVGKTHIAKYAKNNFYNKLDINRQILYFPCLWKSFM